MNDLKVKGNWNESTGKLKQKYAKVTNNNDLFREGKKDEVVGKVQKKLGKAKEEMHKLIEKA
jgi:uncharacterized protein YjbJ (UPF0337 family)